MAVGLSPAVANSQLNVFRGTAMSGVSVYVKLHVGDPGAAGTSNPSAVTTRNPATFNAPSGGSMTLASLASYSMTATETISHISLWDAASAGNFLASAALSSAKAVVSGDTVTLTSLTISKSNLAA